MTLFTYALPRDSPMAGALVASRWRWLLRFNEARSSRNLGVPSNYSFGVFTSGAAAEANRAATRETGTQSYWLWGSLVAMAAFSEFQRAGLFSGDSRALLNYLADYTARAHFGQFPEDDPRPGEGPVAVGEPVTAYFWEGPDRLQFPPLVRLRLPGGEDAMPYAWPDGETTMLLDIGFDAAHGSMADDFFILQNPLAFALRESGAVLVGEPAENEAAAATAAAGSRG